VKRLLSFTICATIFISCVKQVSKKSIFINPYFEKAYAFRDDGNLDSAFGNFNKAKDLFLITGNTFGAGKCLVNMAYISNENNDHLGAQETALQASKYFNLNDTTQYEFIGINYNILGLATYQLDDHSEAQNFYDKAIKYARRPIEKSLYLNNKGKALEETGNYEKALENYYKAINIKEITRSDYARILSNIALTKWLKDSIYNPLPELFEALRIRKEQNHLLGLNSSYAYLSNYYSNKNADSAIYYAEQMYIIAKKINSPKDELISLRKLSILSPAKKAKGTFSKYLSLLDSLQNANENSKNQFALIRFRSEEHKNNFLVAQNENIKKRNNIVQLFFVTIVLLGILIFGYFVYRKRKRQLQQEKDLEVKNTELKYVKKVHDRVANKVYQVISEVENIQELDKEQILDKLDAIYEISRDISYENTAKPYEDFSIKLASMFNSYKSEKVAIDCEGNHTSLWQNVNEVSKEEVFLVMQELLTNMDKHSEASNVQIKIWQEDEQINIHYYDNGIGLPEDLNFNNGLKNTVSRINAIAGTITFESKNKNGLAIQISFPTF